MNWYLEVLKKYAEFNGRARRMEYWMFTLFNFIIAFVLNMLVGFVGEPMLVALPALYGLFVFIPGIAVTVRRLHDTGRSGWWILIVFVPLIGGLVLLVFMIIEGEAGDNAYGSNPKVVVT
ncbi:DUF805 domain-containing protein [Gimesia aquarii]|uniref:Inner membrane protein YhaI n=1 Tax=Gimesia aquarii TaxID=2527964 RepID=A0A517WR17_9PLAN|nr:DUF805 domain-containing protein [Gimesia aquarii]QDU07706.1 Inner membrane protein YhaI [Gimesia aquarii]